jgi:hypothetical protein
MNRHSREHIAQSSTWHHNYYEEREEEILNMKEEGDLLNFCDKDGEH